LGLASFRLADRFVDLKVARIITGGEELPLSPIEVKLLGYLAERPGQLVGRDELLQRVWGYRDGIRSRTIDNTVRRLRLKLEPDPSEPRYLHVVYGQGLRLTGVQARSEPGGPLPGEGFWGRSEELRVLVDAIERGERLVTVLGPAGIGKTRLVQELCSTLARPALLVWVGPRDPDSAVAEALGVAGAGSVERLVPEVLASRGPLVLVLDACEQSAGAVAACVERWSRDARIQVVATSRRPLWPDAFDLAVPPLREEDAVTMFLARTTARDPDLDAVRAFVRSVDAVPLAIELGAARLEVLGPDMLVALGAAGMGSVVRRSLEVLPREVAELLGILAVFEAPFSLEDAAAVAGAPMAGVADALAVLVKGGLVWLAEKAPVRYALYALVRDELAPEATVHHHAHARWMARLGTYEMAERSRSDGGLRRIYRAALADLRAICARAQVLPPELVGRCGVALVTQLGREGPLSEARRLLVALERVPCSASVRALLGRAEVVIAAAHNDPHWIREATERALQHASEPELVVELRATRATSLLDEGDPAGALEELRRCEPLLTLSGPAAFRYHDAVAHVTPSYEEAQEAMLAAARVARRYDDGILEGRALAIAGHNAAYQGAWHLARGYLERSLAVLRSVGLPSRAIGLALQLLGQLERHRGRLDRAECLIREALEHHERLGDLTGITQASIELGLLYVQRGEPASAEPLLDRALSCAGDKPSPSSMAAWCAVAEAALAEHSPVRARQVLEEVLAHARGPELEPEVLPLLAVARASCGEIGAAVELLRRADQIPQGGARAVRLQAMGALVYARAGDRTSAEARLERARALASALEPLPGSDLLQWIARAEQVAEPSIGSEVPSRW
jgi:DNA-binding winged helix-turn-helix (wHTH) protein/tetratricopeptide (TPR) repeat protein